MKTNRCKIPCQLLIATACLVLALAKTQAQDWRSFLDNASHSLRDAAGQAQQRWRDSQRRCRHCGKLIHGRDICTTCLARQTAERAKRTQETVRQTWQQTESQRHEIITRTKEAAASAQREWAESEQLRNDLRRKTIKSVHGARRMTDDIRCKYRELSPELQVVSEKAIVWIEQRSLDASRHYRIASNEYGPRIAAAIEDPHDRRKALEAVGVLLDARRQFAAVQTDVAYQGIKLAGQLRIETPHGSQTLEQVARQRLAQNHPYLRGTPLVEDPAAPLAHLVTADRDYFVNELPLVETGGRRVPIRQAMLESSPFDPTDTLRCLTVLEAADDVSTALDTGEGSIDALECVLSAVEELNR